MVQSTTSFVHCFDGHKNLQFREVILLQAAVMDIDCPHQNVYEVRLHQNAVLQLWQDLSLRQFIELDATDRQLFFEAYTGLEFEGRCFFYTEKLRGKIGSITRKLLFFQRYRPQFRKFHPQLLLQLQLQRQLLQLLQRIMGVKAAV